MFTGIIEQTAVVETIERLDAGARLRLLFAEPGEFRRGESVAVNGVCLTVVPDDHGMHFDLSPETLERSTLGTLAAGARVNIERPMAVGDRLGGHIVQGHVDAVGTLEAIEREGEFAVFRWNYPPRFAPLLVEKGSVAVDGVSLTIVAPDEASFGAALIPETLSKTNFGEASVGTKVNLEFDIMAKFAEKLFLHYLPSARA